MSTVQESSATRYQNIAVSSAETFPCVEFLAAAFLAWCRERGWSPTDPQACAVGQAAAIALAVVCANKPGQAMDISDAMMRDISSRIAVWCGTPADRAL